MIKKLLASTLLFATISVANAQGVPGAHFLENWDLNQDGVVSLEDARERRGDVFTMFDTDEDGSLSAVEYKLFDETRAEDMKQNADGHGQGKGNGGMGRAQEGLTMAFNDVDGNGLVTKDEFVGKTADWLAMMDRDGDGGITVSDFGPRN